MQKIRENLNFQTYFGIGFVLVLGTLSHFFFDWSGENRLVGIFAAVNESTWEHLKLLFFPALLFWVLEWILLAVLLLCYLLFTAFPPHIGLFLDPVTGTYGFPV